MQKDLRVVVGIVAAMWIVRLVDWVLPVDLNQFGMVPRTLHGLLGIITMPFLHAGWGHLIGNTIPLCILLFILIGSRDGLWRRSGRRSFNGP